MAKTKNNYNTVIELEMADGSTVKLTLAYRFLLKLSSTHKQAYKDYNAAWNHRNKEFDEFDTVRMIYAAYLCACIQEETIDEAMSFDDFIDVLTPDREELNRALMELVAPKRAGAIAKRSE